MVDCLETVFFGLIGKKERDQFVHAVVCFCRIRSRVAIMRKCRIVYIFKRVG